MKRKMKPVRAAVLREMAGERNMVSCLIMSDSAAWLDIVLSAHDAHYGGQMNPPKSILDASFRYTPSAGTDLKKTFDRIRRERKAAAERDQANAQEAARVLAQRKIKGQP